MIAYTGVFALTITAVTIGYRSPQDLSVANKQSLASAATIPAVAAGMDSASALHIASTIAAAASSPLTSQVSAASAATNMSSQVTNASQQIGQKPLLVRATPYNRNVTTYVTKNSDSLDSIAKANSISTQTIKWANNLTDDTVKPGTSLSILPVDGIQYTVKDGDTLASISSKYSGNADEITAYNDLELNGIKTGQKIIIPAGILPEEERPGYVAPAPVAAPAPAPAPAPVAAPVITQPIVNTAAGNTYAFGNCTYWAYERRMQLGRPIGSDWGNAATWNTMAASEGFVVNHSPEAGAVFQMPAFIDAYTSAYGHVGIVESVNGDGSINVSEMNYAGGFNTVSHRTIPAAQAALYNYIH